MRKRISLLAASGLVALALGTAPAQAADPVFTLTGPSEVGLRPHPGQSGEPHKTSLKYRVDDDFGATFSSVGTLTIDLSGLKGIADISLGAGQDRACVLNAALVTCRLWGQPMPDGHTVVALDLTAAKDSKAGAIADLTITGAAPGTTFKPATTKVKVGGPDLVVEKAELKSKQNPGDTQGLPIVFANAGKESAKGVALEISTTHGMDLVEKYDNCSFSRKPDPAQPWNTRWSTTVCVLDGEFKPGAVYEISSPLTLKAAPHALVDRLTYGVYTAGEQPKAAQKLTPSGTGQKLAFKERAAKPALQAPATDSWSNTQEFDFDTKNTADFVVGPVSLKGKAGETVKAELGFQNKGPAWVANVRSGEIVAGTEIVMPPGVKMVKVPYGCQRVAPNGLGTPRFVCATGSVVGEKEKVSYAFELKIEKVVADAKGSVTVGQWSLDGGKPHGWDPEHANNKAAFVINAKDGGVTPSPSASTGTPSPKPSTSTSPSASASAKPSSTAGTGTGTGAKANGNLASTGSSAGPLAIGAAVLVAAGGLLFVAVRRRGTGRA
ncbi:hypothetical protein MTF65_19395 [Streptomyces sp. APSN-46.1]|uniref:hypothetical protein n=1 Tax=Streptomyces sp. APSN-46.1 TaxID=2929049 RepID=UPI001FB372F7|nr:hypothetical protein [Streptomyces sp. APSN-46.1]MCJ1679468.1 hypothetical protein [Streptomyces sp. APSN-46.1]